MSHNVQTPVPAGRVMALSSRRCLRALAACAFTLLSLGWTAGCSSSGSQPGSGDGGHAGGTVAGTGGGAAGSGGSATGGAVGTGGATGGAPGTGGIVGSTGGSGGSTSGSGGSATGGRGGGGGGTSGTGGHAGAGGSATGGTGDRAGASGSGTGGASGASGSGSGGSAGGSGGGAGTMQSGGCGKPHTLQNGTITITFNNASRKYILRVPDGYDQTHPYRLVLAYTWSGGTAAQVVSANYFTFATQDSKNTIFAAPDAADGAGTWSNGDVALTDAILTQLEGDLCIDERRVFATGFSFGGGMAMALACTRADVFRAVAFFSGADLTNSCPTTLTKPIAYYASQASEDANGLSTTSPITGEYKQAQFAALNGCTAVPSSTTYPAAGQPHTCTIYKGCSAGHPTEYCVFNGPHGWEPKDPGQTTSWDAPEAWKFITQF
jgi:poly(3-hydroxybutyrate) depolymerase